MVATDKFSDTLKKVTGIKLNLKKQVLIGHLEGATFYKIDDSHIIAYSYSICEVFEVSDFDEFINKFNDFRVINGIKIPEFLDFNRYSNYTSFKFVGDKYKESYATVDFRVSDEKLPEFIDAMIKVYDSVDFINADETC